MFTKDKIYFVLTILFLSSRYLFHLLITRIEIYEKVYRFLEKRIHVKMSEGIIFFCITESLKKIFVIPFFYIQFSRIVFSQNVVIRSYVEVFSENDCI